MIPLRIHRLEKALVAESAQFPVRRQLLQGGLLPYRVVVLQVTAHFGRQDEEAAVDEPAFSLRLFAKAGDFVTYDVKCAEAPGGIDRGYRGEFAMRLVKGDGSRNVDVRQSIAIGEAKCVALDVLEHSRHSASRL